MRVADFEARQRRAIREAMRIKPEAPDARIFTDDGAIAQVQRPNTYLNRAALRLANALTGKEKL